MSISVACPGCGRVLHAWSSLAGKSVVCSGCSKEVLVPITDAEPVTRPEPSSVEVDPRSRLAETAPPSTHEQQSALPTTTQEGVSLLPVTLPHYPFWVRQLHWLLALALLPLAIRLVGERDFDDDFARRLTKSFERLERAPPEVQERALEAFKEIKKRHSSLRELIDIFPEQKLEGAFLSHHTKSHWLMALGAAALFMSFFVLLSRQSAQPAHLVAIGFFTATIGIGLLFLLYLVLFILRLIGIPVTAGLDPSAGFLASFVAFTLLAGFCEELVKALPLLWCYRRAWARTWRSAFLWGMASGAGFGIAEAIGYSGFYYNGIAGPDIYAVRFLSCVALHAVWTGAVGITLHRRQAVLQEADSKLAYLGQLLRIIAIPVLLHGLYDTLLVHEMIWGALGVAVASFLYLAWRIGRLNRGDQATATEEMIQEYWRQKTMKDALSPSKG